MSGSIGKTIVAIGTTHETSVAVIREGEILSAVSEERLSRVKFDTTFFPHRALQSAMKVAGVWYDEVTDVAVSQLPFKDFVGRTAKSLFKDVTQFHALSDHTVHNVRLMQRFFNVYRNHKNASLTRRFVQEQTAGKATISFVDHHQCHAASAYYASPFNTEDNVLVVTLDGVGDELTGTVSVMRDGKLVELNKLYYPNSFGVFYTAVTQMLGFVGGKHEGKITGLAAYGSRNEEIRAILDETAGCRNGVFILNKKYYAEGIPRFFKYDLYKKNANPFEVYGLRNYKQALWKKLEKFSREDIAYAFQRKLEDMVVEYIRHYQSEVGAEHICLAGGVFANVSLNRTVLERLGFEDIFIQPAMGDGGLCLGAGFYVGGKGPESGQRDMYLGPDVSEEGARQALDQRGLVYSRPDNIAEAVGDLLADGKVVARAAGRMEFGPRALGNRSILCNGKDSSINEWLNEKLKRTEFMPFAPAILREDADEYIVTHGKAHTAANFMTITFEVTDKMKRECPAAVHVDGTARPQFVTRDTNPGFHDILESFKSKTGCSSIINTSFNMHEEPIVCTANDAVRAYVQAELDALVVGPYLVVRKES